MRPLIEPDQFPPPGTLEAYRFGWHSSFDGWISITVSRAGRRAQMVGCRQPFEYSPAREIRRAVGAAELRRIRAGFEALMKDPTPDSLGLDGATWRFDAFDGSERRTVTWWCPEPGPVRDLGTRLVRACGFEADDLC